MLLRRYGDGASLHAANRADEMLDAGDLDAWAVWLRNHEVALELGRTETAQGCRGELTLSREE